MKNLKPSVFNRKNITKMLIVASCLIAIILSACKKEADFKVLDFHVEPQRDTAPAYVLFIFEYSIEGTILFKIISPGAYWSENRTVCDTIQGCIQSTVQVHRIDTSEFYYPNAGEYNVTLIVNDKTYSDSFILLPGPNN